MELRKNNLIIILFKISIINPNTSGERSINLIINPNLFNKFLTGASKNSVSSYIKLEKEFVLPNLYNHDIMHLMHIRNSKKSRKNNIDFNKT